MAAIVNETQVHSDNPYLHSKSPLDSTEKISSATPSHNAGVMETDNEKYNRDAAYREKELGLEGHSSLEDQEESTEHVGMVHRVWQMIKPFIFPVFWLLMTGYAFSSRMRVQG